MDAKAILSSPRLPTGDAASIKDLFDRYRADREAAPVTGADV